MPALWAINSNKQQLKWVIVEFRRYYCHSVQMQCNWPCGSTMRGTVQTPDEWTNECLSKNFRNWAAALVAAAMSVYCKQRILGKLICTQRTPNKAIIFLVSSMQSNRCSHARAAATLVAGNFFACCCCYPTAVTTTTTGTSSARQTNSRGVNETRLRITSKATCNCCLSLLSACSLAICQKMKMPATRHAIAFC